MKKNFKNNTSRGFTLIEIMVSLTIFIVVAVIALGAFLKILDANKQSQALQTAMNNANFALESMVRDLRVGYGYDCVAWSANPPSVPADPTFTSCGLSTSTISFHSSETPVDGASCPDPIHAYWFDSASGTIDKAETNCGGTTSFIPLTAPDFKILSFQIKVDGDPTASTPIQPKVLIVMKASAGSNAQNQTVFTTQTTVAQRLMNKQ